jgi:hypothetical protein
MKRNPQINIRLPEELKEKLHNKALENERSVNFEVVERLQKSLEYDDFLKVINDSQLEEKSTIYTDMIRLYVSAVSSLDAEEYNSQIELMDHEEKNFREEMRARLTTIEKLLAKQPARKGD